MSSRLDRFLGLFGVQRARVAEAASAVTLAPSRPPAQRTGYEYGIPDGGLDEVNSGSAAGSDRRGLLGQLYEAYRTCPWSWSAVNAIARTITAGGLVTDYEGGGEDGDVDEVPAKPAQVLALERLIEWCNPREDIRQLLRGVIVDLLVFGDAFIEVVWLAGIPVALYSLDAPSMYPIADKHGTITGYVQVTELQQRAEFEPHEVIHISMDSPRSGIYGVSPTEAALLPITVWLFASATIKELFRKGNPPNIHVDFPASMQNSEINRWVGRYLVQNLGPRNIGTPVPTKGGATINELKQGALGEYLSTLDQKRDEILATYGVPPAEATVIESGNLGGGTGESQRKTFLANTCSPIAALVLEKIVYSIVRNGFGITDWTVKFKDVDTRDSKIIEEIRDARIRNGTWTVNRARAEVGEPAIDGGDDAAIVSNTGTVTLVRDLVAASQAAIAAKLKGSALEPDEPVDGAPLKLVKPEPEPVPDVLAPFAGQDNPPDDDEAGHGKRPAEVTARDLRALDEAWMADYRRRRRQALAELASAA